MHAWLEVYPPESASSSSRLVVAQIKDSVLSPWAIVPPPCPYYNFVVVTKAIDVDTDPTQIMIYPSKRGSSKKFW